MTNFFHDKVRQVISRLSSPSTRLLLAKGLFAGSKTKSGSGFSHLVTKFIFDIYLCSILAFLFIFNGTSSRDRKDFKKAISSGLFSLFFGHHSPRPTLPAAVQPPRHNQQRESPCQVPNPNSTTRHSTRSTQPN
ncbi:hypothetical protein BDV06DRAFT_183098 [Aspergillus oleicola]